LGLAARKCDRSPKRFRRTEEEKLNLNARGYLFDARVLSAGSQGLGASPFLTIF
jgi:hypothetical protein